MYKHCYNRVVEEELSTSIASHQNGTTIINNSGRAIINNSIIGNIYTHIQITMYRGGSGAYVQGWGLTTRTCRAWTALACTPAPATRCGPEAKPSLGWEDLPARDWDLFPTSPGSISVARRIQPLCGARNLGISADPGPVPSSRWGFARGWGFGRKMAALGSTLLGFQVVRCLPMVEILVPRGCSVGNEVDTSEVVEGSVGAMWKPLLEEEKRQKLGLCRQQRMARRLPSFVSCPSSSCSGTTPEMMKSN